MVTKRVVGRDT